MIPHGGETTSFTGSVAFIVLQLSATVKHKTNNAALRHCAISHRAQQLPNVKEHRSPVTSIEFAGFGSDSSYPRLIATLGERGWQREFGCQLHRLMHDFGSRIGPQKIDPDFVVSRPAQRIPVELSRSRSDAHCTTD